MRPPTPQTLALLALGALLVVSPAVLAQGQPTGDPYLVRDLPDDGLVPLATNLAGLDAVETADRLLVTAREPGEQLERGWLLWATDGTPAGSVTLLDPPAFLAPVGATDDFALLFEGVGASGVLWVSDGTVAGTRPLGIEPGRAGEGHALGDEVVFLVTRGDDEGIWLTDGTAAGTRLLRRADTDNLELADAVEVDGRLVFDRFAPANADRPGLWVTDGSAAGTFPIVEPAEGGELLAVSLLAPVSPGDGPAFFAGRTAARGLDLYVTDGTVAGTRLAAHVEPGPGDVRLLTPVVYDPSSDGYYVVAAARQQPADLWQVGPGSGGGRVVSDLDAQGIVLEGTAGAELAVHDGRLVLAAGGGLYAHEGTPGPVVSLAPDAERWDLEESGVGTDLFVDRFTTDGGVEIWTTDGTPGGTGLYADLCPGTCQDGIARFHRSPGGDALALVQDLQAVPSDAVNLYLLAPGGPVALTAFEGGTQVERFLGDAGPETVFRVETIEPNPDPIDGSDVTASGRLWSTDGTPAGTGPLPPIALEEPEPGSIVEMVAFRAGDGAGVAFTVQDPSLEPRGYFYPAGRGQTLWLSDGTEQGTREIYRGPRVPPYAVTGLFDLTPQGDRLVFLGLQAGSGDPPTWEVLAAADGSVESLLTLPVADFASSDEEIIGLEGSGDRVYLRTTDGFRLLAPEADAFGPLVPVPWTRGDDPPVRLGGDDLFVTALAADRPDSWQVVATDGTPAGTRVLAQGTGGQVASLVRQGDRAYFTVLDFGTETGELWVTDGTVAGTRESSAFGDPGPDAMVDLFVAGGTLFGETFELDFSGGSRSSFASGLRATDGTAASAVQVHGDPVGDGVALGDRLLFVSEARAHGRELWVSDGTPSGTDLLADLVPGSSFPDQLLRVGGVVYFTAFDPATGVELWVTDGTAAGTRRVADLATGVRSSTPDVPTPSGDRLFFEAAGSAAEGRELFALPIAPVDGGGGGGDGEIPPRPVTPPLTSPAVPGFRFWVEITPQGQAPLIGSAESACIPETVCVSGALAGRTEVFLRVIGPRPNGLLWPVITRFTPSRVEVWIEQASSGDLRYYELPATDPDAAVGDLTGLFDRNGLTP